MHFLAVPMPMLVRQVVRQQQRHVAERSGDGTVNADGNQPFGRGELERLTLDYLAASPGRQMTPQDIATALAAQLNQEKAIMGIFDEGCMGMYNAIIDDELLNPTGIYKERLSQSALVAEMRTVSDADARAVIATPESAAHARAAGARTVLIPDGFPVTEQGWEVQKE